MASDFFNDLLGITRQHRRLPKILYAKHELPQLSCSSASLVSLQGIFSLKEINQIS
jgi:hypothetical protein